MQTFKVLLIFTYKFILYIPISIGEDLKSLMKKKKITFKLITVQSRLSGEIDTSLSILNNTVFLKCVKLM